MTHIALDNFKNLQTLVTTHTSDQVTSSSGNNFTTVSGSEMTYTPASDANNVVYEISFYAERGGRPFLIWQLEHYTSGSWSEINPKYRKTIGISGSSSQSYSWYITWRFVLPSWTGSRQLRLRVASHSSNRHVNLHQITKWDGSTVTDQFCNTNLVVYST